MALERFAQTGLEGRVRASRSNVRVDRRADRVRHGNSVDLRDRFEIARLLLRQPKRHRLRFIGTHDCHPG